VKAHDLLFTRKNMEKFDPTGKEFLSLLDNQIGRVTRKFMGQRYHIAVANCVAMLGFASKDNVLMKAMPSPDIDMEGSPSDHTSQSLSSFRNTQPLSNSPLRIVLQRIGDPNVLPFIHTLLASYGSPSHIEDEKFPLPEKDDVRPFPEDFAVRGLLWTDRYFPEEWFTNEKIDEEEKYHELGSMTAERKERILWLGLRVANHGHGLNYDGQCFSAPGNPDAAQAWSPSATGFASDPEEDLTLPGHWEKGWSVLVRLILRLW
jgi:hypothetical protein